jgi:two-component system sensor histidine kinase PilS (NtrC family)
MVPFVLMYKTERHRMLGWFLPSRLASYIIIMAVVVLWMGYPDYLHFQFVLYSVLTLAFAVLVALDKQLRLKAVVQTLVVLQFLLEITIESGVVYATGNINSPLSGLYILTIVSAALAYRLTGTLLLASVVSVAYAFVIWLGLVSGTDSGLSMRALKTVLATHDSVFYSIFLHILIFYLVAFISGFMAERLYSRDRQLANASRELRRAKLETDQILRHVNSGLITIDAQGYVIYFNRAAEKILGYSEEQVRGMKCREIFSERMPSLARYLMAGIRRREAFPRKELEIVGGDRRLLPLGLSTSVLTDESNGLLGVIAIFSDLTEPKAMEAKIRAADRLAAVGELSASIAHEIRNPLAAISGSVELLTRELSLSGENKRLMDLIIKESDRLNLILTDFLSFARITRPVYNKVDLCHTVSDVIKLLHHHSSFRDNIRIELESDQAIVYVVGDEDLIKQLLMNLVLNACESFAGEAGKVVLRIAVDHHLGTVELYVQDDGPGMTGNVRERVFEPFYSTKKGGTGLGLSIVHRIVSTMHLELNVDSQPGYGTTFLIQFQSYSQNSPGQYPPSVAPEETEMRPV